MLRNSRGEAFQIEGDLLPVLVVALDSHRNGSFDRDRNALHGEATFVVHVDLVALADELGVDEHGDHVLLRREHEHSPQHTDLRRCEADTVRVFHQLPHPVDQPQQVVVELLDAPRLHPQHRIRILANLRQGEPAPGSLLGIELVGLDLSLDLRHLRHRLRCRHQEVRAALARPSEPTGRCD